MSRTDKDRPWWVQVHDAANGLVEHDHRDGRCEISDNRSERWRSWRHHSREVCRKYERIDFTCTKRDPYVDPRAWRLDPRSCWRSWFGPVEPGNPYAGYRWESIQCVGHHRWERHDEIPCSCDDQPTATCFPEAPADSSWGHYVRGGVPSAFVRQYYHKPERGRERAALTDAARRFNAGEDLEGEDILPERQARNSCRWLYW